MKLKNSLEKVLDDASTFVILNDRSLYDPFFEVFENYVADNDLVYIGSAAINAIMKKHSDTSKVFKLSHKAYMVHVIHDNPEAHYRKLVDALMLTKSRHINTDTIAYTETLPGKEYLIHINTRLCFKLSDCGQFRETSLLKALVPQIGQGLWTQRDILCQNMISLLITVYSDLYDPNKIPDPVSEDILYKIFVSTKIGSGSMDCLDIQGGSSKHNRRDNNQSVNRTPKSDNLYLIPGRGKIPSYVYTGTLLEIKDSNNGPMVRYYMNDLDDFLLAKFTFYDKNEHALFSVYNSSEHQVIPVLTNKKEVAPIAAARFKLVEVQMLMIMSHFSADMARKVSGAIEDALADYHKLRNEINDGPVKYIGNCVKWEIIKKQMRRGKGFPTPIYLGKIVRTEVPESKEGSLDVTEIKNDIKDIASAGQTAEVLDTLFEMAF